MPNKFDSKQGAIDYACDYIAKQTGLRSTAVKKFVDDNDIDLTGLIMDVGQKKINPMDLVTAITGRPNNRYFKQIVTKYRNESIDRTYKLVESAIGKIIRRVLTEAKK